MKRILIGLALVVVPLLAAALILPSFVDWNRYKIEISEAARDMTGRDVAIDGAIAFSVLPSPALSVHQVRVANLPGANSVDLLTLKSLEVRVAFLPLLRGRIIVNKIVLVEPVVELEVLADGGRNWELGSDARVPGGEDADPAPGFANIQLDNFVVTGGRITYRDSARGRVVTVDNLNAGIIARSLRGPVEVNGELSYGGLPMTFKLATGRVAPDRPLGLNLTLTLTPSRADIDFSGAINGDRADRRLTGKLTVGGPDLSAALADLAVAGGKPGPAFAKTAPARSFLIKTPVSYGDTGAALEDIEFQLGNDGADVSARGSLALNLDGTTAVDAKLAITSLDLDSLLAGGVSGADGGQDIALPAAAPSDQPATALAGDEGGFALPSGLGAKLDLSIAALTYRQRVVREVRVAAELGDGVLEINWATARLPGSSDISITGAISAKDAKPRFDGKVKAASNNLRALLGWLGLDPTGVPPDRLTKVAASGSLAVTGEAVQFYNVDMGLDTSRLTGGFAYALRARPSFSVDAEIDRLNLDAYLPPRRPGGDEEAVAATAAATDLPALSGLSGLTEFDTNFKLKLGRITYRQTPLTNVIADAALVGGVLSVHEFSGSIRSDGHFAVTGSATHFAAKPSVKAVIDLAGGDLKIFQRLLDFNLPPAFADPGPVALTANIEGGLSNQLGVDVDLNLGATRIKAMGMVSDLAASPRFNLTVDAANDSLDATIRQFDLALRRPLAGFDRPVSLKGTVNGNVGSLDVNVALLLAGGRLTVVGSLAPKATDPTVDLTVGLVHDDLVACLRGLGFNYQPASNRLGGIELAGHVASGPEGVAVSGVSGNIGPASVEGDVNVRLGGARPRLTAQISAGEIVVDNFIAPPTTGAKQARGISGAQSGAKSEPGARWSSRPLGFDRLGDIDADVELSARRIAYGAYDFVVPVLALRLAGGTLELSRLTGKLFGGDLSMTAEVRTNGAPALDTGFTLRGASLEKALRATADLAIASGDFDMRGEFKTTGRGQAEMIAALDGTADLTVRDGVVRGVDIAGLNRGLTTAENRSEVMAVIRQSLGRGETAFSGATAKLVVAKGIARTEDVGIDMDGAEVTADATVDLPAWRIDARTRFWLADHPDMPPLGMDIGGPLNDPATTILNRDFVTVLVKNLGAAALRKVFNQPGGGGLRELLGISKAKKDPGPPATSEDPANSANSPTSANPLDPSGPSRQPSSSSPTARPGGELPVKTTPEAENPASRLFDTILDTLAPKAKKKGGN